MASIQKRGKKYAVVYTYTDSADVKRQKWETYGTKKEAAARKAQVENEMNNGTFIPPSSVTVRDFLADFVELYGSKRWGLSAYSGNTGIINNYINPVIGDMNVQDVTRRTVDSFIAQLQKMKPVSTTYRNARSEFLPPNTIEKVCKVLHCAFRQAVRWDMVPKNPFDDVLLPKKEKNPRAIWTADIIRQALDNCSEGKLYVAINLSFACSLRMGEITGLTWDCVHISDSDIAKDDAHIIVNKELRSLSPSSRSIFAVESLKSATRNFEKLMDILEFLLTHDLKFASTNFYIENGHVERRIKPLRAGHTSKEIQKNLSQTAGLGYRHAAALNQL